MRCYTEAIRLKPDDATAYNNQGLMHQSNGEMEAAKQDFEKAELLNN